jgi:hypothetical protein
MISKTLYTKVLTAKDYTTKYLGVIKVVQILVVY